ncbi:hypothetical protein [Chitiniphilus eburneus]|uniref:Uncharacterized protein n=1 Tax=Chitiniphilus eburneus TaxID=2571148 RepID=A0A4U0PXG9_9NEIS|nr:hypothetical protein [Chitiniphilus eburneus]TJZ73283.1 hypothetical protein FAZ21_10480 [Chitiniphilus eburneus]
MTPILFIFLILCAAVFSLIYAALVKTAAEQFKVLVLWKHVIAYAFVSSWTFSLFALPLAKTAPISLLVLLLGHLGLGAMFFRTVANTPIRKGIAITLLANVLPALLLGVILIFLAFLLGLQGVRLSDLI